MCRDGIGDPGRTRGRNARKRWQTGRNLTGMKRPRRTPDLDRNRLRKLLALLGSDQDGEVLNAARHIDALVKAAGTDWQALIPDAAPAGLPSDDLIRLDQLIASERVADVLKLRLRDMRSALQRGQLAEADRRLLRVLHRKAVIDGAIVEL
jgi:hypothetical protein